MNPSLFPTKGNLLLMKRSLGLAKLGYELMDKKRNVMIMEMMRLIDRAAEIQSEIDRTFSEAYAALQETNTLFGIENISSAALCSPEDTSVEIKFRSVMGVEIPSLAQEPSIPEPRFGFELGGSSLDEAYIKFLKVKDLIRKQAEIENSVYRLATSIKKTQKRANALSDIIIPMYQGNIKFIAESLEEKEREEFVRLKVIKNQQKRAY